MKNCPTCGTKVVTRKKKNFPDGGDVGSDEDTPPPDTDDDLPMGTNTPAPPDQDLESNAPPTDPAQAGVASQFGPGSNPPTPDDSNAPLPDEDEDTSEPEDAQIAEGAPATPTGNMFNDNDYETPPPPPPPVQDANYMNQQDFGFSQDLGSGVIKPETYHDWFAKKGTLGKVGTLFGLMLSGAGSGLSHQPNALLDMMNKEIDRDLDAQKATNVNQQNWYNLALRHEMQNATINKMGYDNAYTAAQTGKVPYEMAQLSSGVQANLAAAYQHAVEADLTRGKIKELGGGAFDLAASNSARNKMMLGATQYIQDIVNNLPPGAQKVAGQAQLDGTVRPAVGAQVQQNNAKAAAQVQVATNGGQSVGPTVDPDVYGQHLQQYAKTQKAQADAQAQANGNPPAGAIDYGKLNTMIGETRNRAALGLPPAKNGITEGDLGGIQKESQDLEDNRVAARAYNHAFTKINNLWDKGALNEEAYNAQVGTLGPQIARETAGRFNMSEANTQLGGLFPNYKDYASSYMGGGNTAKEKYQNGINYFMGKEQATPTLNRHPELKTPFPNMPNPFAKPGATATNKKTGERMQQDAKGNWVPLK